MASIIPTISSGTAGPLGVLHLPRLWQKASLSAVGKLHPDYPACGQGYDQMVLDGLEIERQSFLSFICEQKPTYAQTEAWILDLKGGALDDRAVNRLNAAIAAYEHEDAVRETILKANGIQEDVSIRDAVNLNNMDDWYRFHQKEIV